MPELLMLDMREVGRRLGLSAESAKRLVREGKLKARMHKNKYVCTPADVEAYVAALPKVKLPKETAE